MSTIFNRLKQHEKALEEVLFSRAFLSPVPNTYSWTNKIFTSSSVRRAHLDCIDATQTKKLYMMHLCIFPQVNLSSPIYGFDIIAGPNKVTGAFLDFSPVVIGHPLSMWYANFVKDLTWSKPRQLPEWAQRIFSKNMIAAGNINTIEELDVILDLSLIMLNKYLDLMGSITTTEDYTSNQNYYCQQQKCNPHTPRVLQSIGFDQEMVHDFIHNCLFPEIN
jgi:hypothetical protein